MKSEHPRTTIGAIHFTVHAPALTGERLRNLQLDLLAEGKRLEIPEIALLLINEALIVRHMARLEAQP
jgi:hypothetical protein